MNYKIQENFYVKNRIIGEGDKLCIWLKGEIDKEKIGYQIKSQSKKITGLKFQQIEFLKNKNVSLCIVILPKEMPLFEEFEVDILQEGHITEKLAHLFLVPNIELPEAQIKENEIKLQFKSESLIGTPPYQFTWRNMSNKGEVIKSGEVQKLSDLPSLIGMKKNNLLNFIIKDANQLILNKWVINNDDSLSNTNDLDKMGNSIKIFPNPSDQYLTISRSLFENDQETKFKIYDMQGKLVMEEQQISKDKNTLDISRLPQGLYSIQIGIEKPIISNFIKL
ncbi:MAG: T9SS type A sorting domain-containing protein [Bacteroidia bacterium]